MEHKVSRQHRVAAVAAMYPDCKHDSPMWRDFVEAGDAQSYRTLERVAQMAAGGDISYPETRAGQVGNCKDCRHWHDDADSYSPDDPKRLCGRILPIYDAYGRRRADSGAEVSGEAGEAGGLATDADFGCVLWEPRVFER